MKGWKGYAACCLAGIALAVGVGIIFVSRARGDLERQLYDAQCRATLARRGLESTIRGLVLIGEYNRQLVAINRADGAELERLDGIIADKRAADDRARGELLSLAQSTAAGLASARSAGDYYRVVYGICEQLFVIYHGYPRGSQTGNG